MFRKSNEIKKTRKKLRDENKRYNLWWINKKNKGVMVLENHDKLCGLIGLATKAGRITYGTDACLEDIKKGKVKLIIVAKDASDRTKITFQKETEKYGIWMYEGLSIEQISKAIGKLNKAVVGVKDIGFSNKMISIINGGEMIG